MITEVRGSSHRIRGRIRAPLTVVTMLVTLVFVPAGAAVADPPEPGNASCMGYEASAVSPPGSSDEAPGGMPNVLADVDAFFVAPNGEFKNRGQVIRLFTQLDADSHEACDQALFEAVFGDG